MYLEGFSPAGSGRCVECGSFQKKHRWNASVPSAKAFRRTAELPTALLLPCAPHTQNLTVGIFIPAEILTLTCTRLHIHLPWTRKILPGAVRYGSSVDCDSVNKRCVDVPSRSSSNANLNKTGETESPGMNACLPPIFTTHNGPRTRNQT